ncbi:hypothetical protein NW755_006448 [Fusarium falciforme]|uniref:Phytocyanin domain-containing protein n=1 Tax=Fusarium falciforme TaxID=195108 RepID=A0A9W8R939_9HYPO|nr:hypothetical protein NW755_006448 [Fusarium falciforme]
MQFTNLSVALFALLAVGASAATHRVEVGKGGLKYTPDTISAAKGDIIEFHFDSMHTVVAGDFDKPCTPATSGGFYSGDLPASGNSFFSITVNNTDPIFFYCVIEGHCQAGMAGVINQGSDTLKEYQSAAANTDKSTSPKAAFGGTVSSKSITESTSTTTTTASESSSTVSASITTTTASESPSTGTSTTSSPAAVSPSSVPAAAPQLTGPIVCVSLFALIFGAMLAF